DDLEYVFIKFHRVADGRLTRKKAPLDRAADDHDVRRVWRIALRKSRPDKNGILRAGKYPPGLGCQPPAGGRPSPATRRSLRSKGTVQLLPVSGTTCALPAATTPGSDRIAGTARS